MKIVKTKIMDSDLIAAQGGQDLSGMDYRIWVLCPDHYDVEKILAQDIIDDSQIIKDHKTQIC